MQIEERILPLCAPENIDCALLACRWGCVSHRHNCPLFVLLSTAQCSPDVDLQHIAAASLLAFSIQNECQLQIDAVSGIPVLLRLLDCRDAGT